MVDLESGIADSEAEDSGIAEIWLTETSPGGGGVIERLLPRLSEEPRRFLDLIQGGLGRSDYEIVDDELRRFLTWLETDSEIESLVTAVRDASTQATLSESFEKLRPL